MKFLHITLLIAYTVLVQAQSSLDNYILDKMETKHISGFSAVLVQNGEIKWFGNYGLANREENIPVSENTIYMLASISKTITGTAVMQLYEDDWFELEDPVSYYVPFDVFNPNYPDSLITIKQLLTHTSSIRDNWSLLPYFDGDAPIALSDFLFDYLSVDGENYDAAANFYTYAPNAQYNYSNVAVALLGYLVEEISGQPFNEYCNDHIFEPLCMENTGWFLSELDTSLIAHPYSYFGGDYEDQGLYGYPDYPDGQLRTTLFSLAKFMYAHINYGEFDGYQLLDSATVALMRTELIPELEPLQGLIFYGYEDEYGTWMGHNGGDAGVSTDMFYNEAEDIGLIVLTNSDANHEDIWYEILEASDTLLNQFVDAVACEITIPLAAENISSSQMNVYPNPADDYIFIQDAENKNSITQIYNLQGKLVLETSHNKQIYLGEFPAGIYTIKYFNKENIILKAEKLIIE